MKPIVLLDIDDTLLNTRELGVRTGRHLVRKLSRLARAFAGRDGKRFRELLRPELQGFSYLFFRRPAGFLRSPAVRDSFLNPAYYRRSLFPDVVPTLKKLRGRVSLGIFSQGLTNWQFAKLYLSGIESYFEREILFVLPLQKVEKAREVLSQLPQKAKVCFVDNRPDIAAALANHRVRVFLIRRNPLFFSGIERVTIIRSLREILDLV